MKKKVKKVTSYSFTEELLEKIVVCSELDVRSKNNFVESVLNSACDKLIDERVGFGSDTLDRLQGELKDGPLSAEDQVILLNFNIKANKLVKQNNDINSTILKLQTLSAERRREKLIRDNADDLPF